MKMTARDTEILRMVNRHRFLRSSQIADLVVGSRQQVLRRLQMLFHHGYLERPTCQIDYYHRGGSRSIAYGLASRGAAHLRRVHDIQFSRLNWTSRTRAVKRLFLEHALMISEIMVSLEIACRHREDICLLVEDEIPLPHATRNLPTPFQWIVTDVNGERLGVIPDRVFALEISATGERVICFLEADRGTMPLERTTRNRSSFERKAYSYVRSWQSNVYQTKFGVSRIRVLTVALNAVRCRGICNKVAAVSHCKGMFLQSFIAAISPETVLDHIWHGAADKQISILCND